MRFIPSAIRTAAIRTAIIRTGCLILLVGAMAIAAADFARADCQGCFGTIAGGISGNKVGIGAAFDGDSPDAADTAAIQQCGQSVDVKVCKVLTRFLMGGCGYITSAVANGTCAGYGPTAAEATKQCEARGCGACNKPIGGCTKRQAP